VDRLPRPVRMDEAQAAVSQALQLQVNRRATV
jgi:hypothetical protein